MGCLCLDTASVVRSSVAERIVILQTPPEVIGLNELAWTGTGLTQQFWFYEQLPKNHQHQW